MNTHNACFYEEIRKIYTGYPPLSRPVISVICHLHISTSLELRFQPNVLFYLFFPDRTQFAFYEHSETLFLLTWPVLYLDCNIFIC